MDDNAYSGRWVARIRGQIIAQGGTPEQARLAASSRFKERPEILFMPTSVPILYPDLLLKAISVLPASQAIYLVGGAVRDLLLGRACHDFDFALPRGGIPAARRVANALNGKFYALDQERDMGRVLITDPQEGHVVMDFASFQGADLDTDLRNRDFTLNAIAVDPRSGEVFDPLGGGQDLKEKHLRACSPQAFSEDPIRILRGIRLAANFGFHILPETRKAMKAAAGLLVNTSPERLRDELFRILEGRSVASCLRALDLLGAMVVILPELNELKGVAQPEPHVHDAWEHTLALMDRLEEIISALAPTYNAEKAADLLNGLLVLRIGRFREPIDAHLSTHLPAGRSQRGILFMAALYHDVAKPKTRQTDENGRLRFWDHDIQGAEVVGQRGRQLALSNEEVARLETIVRNHMRIPFHANRLLKEGKSPTRRAVYRFFRDSSTSGIDLCLLALADLRATYEQHLSQETWAAALDVVRLFLENWIEKPEEAVTPPSIVNGDDLMEELHLTPGPQVGELLEAIREAQAMGEVSTREQAISLARNRLA